MLLDPNNLIGDESFESKFVRVGNDLYITDPNDLTTLHIQLAEKHKILERIYFMKENNQDEIDGGIIFFTPGVIRIGSASTSLSIPLTKKARFITLDKLKKRMQRYSIRELTE